MYFLRTAQLVNVTTRDNSMVRLSSVKEKVILLLWDSIHTIIREREREREIVSSNHPPECAR